MHESGLFERLARTAIAEAEQRGAKLRGMTVRLGALASMDEAHFFEHWNEVAPRMGLEGIVVTVCEEPAHPAGLELIALDLSEPAS